MCTISLLPAATEPHAGSGVVRTDLLHFLADCCMLSSSVFLLSFTLTPHIYLIILISMRFSNWHTTRTSHKIETKVKNKWTATSIGLIGRSRCGCWISPAGWTVVSAAASSCCCCCDHASFSFCQWQHSHLLCYQSLNTSGRCSGYSTGLGNLQATGYWFISIKS